MKHLAGACATFVMLSACEISGSDTASPNPPTVSALDVDRALAQAEDASNLPFTATSNLPTGSVTYDGQIGADLTGDSLGSMLGDMTMRVDFADNRIGGSVSNINLIDQDGTPNQRLDGTLEIAGFENNGDLDAGASGRIGAVSTDGEELNANMNLDLEGAVRSDNRFGDTVYGVVSGDARGDFNLDVDGRFYGDRR